VKASHRLAGLTPTRLRLGLGLLLLALALPTAVLIRHAYGQLKWEAFHQQRVLAEEFARRVDDRLARLVAAEEARAVTDYAFLVVGGDPAARYVTRSPLAAFPIDAAVPGLVGHFQVDAAGRFGSPLLPGDGVDAARYGVAADELAARRARVARIRDLLGRNRLAADRTVAATGARRNEEATAERPAGDVDDSRAARLSPSAEPASAPEMEEQKSAPAQALFDRLDRPGEAAAARDPTPRSLGKVDELRLEQGFRARAEAQSPPAPATGQAAPAPRQARKEQNLLVAPDAAPAPPLAGPAEADTAAGATLPIRTFESDVEPFRFALLDGDHFVLYRNVWRAGQRTVQGLLVEREALLREQLQAPFAATALAGASDLLVAWRGDVLALFGGGSYVTRAAELRGELLHRARLSAPLGGLELLFSVTDLPPGPGASVLAWVSGVLGLVLLGGFALLYRLGLGQLRLVRQQQDFVSAVSHELKTPLTSIRMYGEMLREGWVDEARKQSYYDYIHGESERLSRLIDNVLQLARLERNGVQVARRQLSAGALCELARAKVAAQVERAGFTLAVDCGDADVLLDLDPDLFLQVVINLVDNGLKFAAGAARRQLDLGCRRLGDGDVQFHVRDYGPGVPPGQMKKIFRLFYRPGNELTRETVGTGIGLALVRQLTVALGGAVDVVNRDPGAEFQLRFPAVPPTR
jgi:signal transduction histidine kinase